KEITRVRAIILYQSCSVDILRCEYLLSQMNAGVNPIVGVNIRKAVEEVSQPTGAVVLIADVIQKNAIGVVIIGAEECIIFDNKVKNPGQRWRGSPRKQ